MWAERLALRFRSGFYFDTGNSKLKPLRMNHAALRRITKSLAGALRELKSSGLWDKNRRCKYAEYLVAERLASRGHKVQLLNEREKKSADIYLADIGKSVEIKSCRLKDGWGDASFCEGNQLRRKKFDYCVWVILDSYGKLNLSLVFSANELKEIGKSRGDVFSHRTNQCLLLLAPNSDEYEKYIKDERIKPFRIERELLRRPRKYRDAWGKIK